MCLLQCLLYSFHSEAGTVNENYEYQIKIRYAIEENILPCLFMDES